MDYETLFEKNVISRLRDVKLREGSSKYSDMRPVSVFVGIVIGAIISQFTQLNIDMNTKV
tara:strand:- start:2104 stop:2283 length:180 start_codon:yes stop_codon:yes gene_type:complete